MVPAEALCEGWASDVPPIGIMHYIHLLRSQKSPEHTYVGYTTNIKERLEEHNSGKSYHTAKERPWRLVTFLGFDEKEKAYQFEKYLKSGSGKAFAQKRFW